MYAEKQRLSEAQILAELRQVQASIMCDRTTNTAYLMSSNAREVGIRLDHAVGQKLPRQTAFFRQGTNP